MIYLQEGRKLIVSKQFFRLADIALVILMKTVNAINIGGHQSTPRQLGIFSDMQTFKDVHYSTAVFMSNVITLRPAISACLPLECTVDLKVKIEKVKSKHL